MSTLLRHVLPLALGAAVSPTVLTVAVLTLTARDRPVARGLAFTLGVAAVVGALTVLGLTVMAHVTDHPSATRRAVSDGLDAAFGLVLLVLGVRSILRRRDPAPAEPSTGAAHRTGLLAALTAGVVMMATNVTSIVLYLPAMKEVAQSGVDSTDKAVVVAVAAAIVTAPAWIPVGMRIVAPGPSQHVLRTVDTGIQRHRHTIVTGVELLFGAYLLARGLGA